jgi:cytochrome c oxidase cbb3-type subunit 3
MAATGSGFTDELLAHDADGIHEYDNPSPDWLVYLFYATIVFGIGYVIYYGFSLGPSIQDAYLMEGKQLEKQWADYYAANPITPPTTEELVAAAQNPQLVAEGKEQFAKTCASCHGDNAQGLIGPNLTDDRWIHGGKLTEIYSTLVNGVTAKGMPPWGRALAPEKITALTSYLRALQGSSPAGPKAPEGEQVVPDPI